MSAPRVIVLGGGVSGLTCGVVLAETRRFDVTLVAEKVGLESLSRVAGASWYPHHVHHPRLRTWLAASLAEFRRLAAVTDSGVRVRPAVEFGAKDALPFDATLMPLEWADGAWRFETPIIDVPIYLPWMLRRFDLAGGAIRLERVASLDELCAPAVVVVNCTCAEARRTVPDLRVTPTLGQIVRVADAQLETFCLDARSPGRPTYIVPRTNDAVLGSIDVAWPVDERGYEPPAPDLALTADIVERCAALDPAVRGARILDSYCGLRPVRDEVRVEVDAARLATGLRVVHDYGHGGAGITLSWGCAAEVLALVGRLTT